ncbi:MAG TPA: hypothetical protein DDZ31_01210 [Actinobacteria bacterium]|nr:hypothetical protein [Actinomycetota bacterium]
MRTVFIGKPIPLRLCTRLTKFFWLPDSINRDITPRVSIVTNVTHPQHRSPSGINTCGQTFEITSGDISQCEFADNGTIRKLQGIKPAFVARVVVNPHNTRMQL